MGQRLIKVLDQPTMDGFVYRVDMRLRPFGDSGPLVLSFAALEDYYQEQGRDWERYAMVKARIMGPQRLVGSVVVQGGLRCIGAGHAAIIGRPTAPTRRFRTCACPPVQPDHPTLADP